ncbi:MAG: cell envelope integrity protein TolA [Proteobacteria bacterium]|nr:cell envelope integrity protein TolA [Pseudomonadota bacterium]
MAQQATWQAGRPDDGMARAFVYAVLIHVVIVLFAGLSFRWSSDNQNTGESVIKAKAVTLPAKPVAKPKPRPKAKPKPKPVKKAKPKPVIKKTKKAKPKNNKKQKQAEQLLKQQLAQEQAAAAAAAEKASALMDKYRAVIRQKVSRNWVKPAGITEGRECIVRVRLIAGGEVVNAEVVKSSGDAAFDRSVESAVYKAAPLPVPSEPDMFEYFRDIEFLFRPED